MSERTLNVVLRVTADTENQSQASAVVQGIREAQEELNQSVQQGQSIVQQTEEARLQASQAIIEALRETTAAQQELANVAAGIDWTAAEEFAANLREGFNALDPQAINNAQNEILDLTTAVTGLYDPAERVAMLLHQQADHAQRAATAQQALAREAEILAGLYDQLWEAIENNDGSAAALNNITDLTSAIETQTWVAGESARAFQTEQDALDAVNEQLAESQQATEEYTRAMDRLAAANNKFLASAQRMMTGATQLARSFVLATVAKEEDAKAAMQLIAKFESVVQGMKGVINTGKAATDMWRSYRQAATAAAAVRTAGGAASAMGAGGAAAGAVGTGGAGIAAAAVPIAAFAAALVGAGAAAKVLQELFTGTADNIDSFSNKIAEAELSVVKSFYSLTDNLGIVGKGLQSLFENSSLGQLMGADDIKAAHESDKAVKKMEEERAKRREADKFLDKQFDLYSPLERIRRESARSQYEFESGAGHRKAGLSGTALESAKNDSSIEYLKQQLAQGFEAFNSGGKSAIDAEQQRASSLNELIKLERERVELTGRAAQEGIAAAKEQLETAKQTLATAEQARKTAQSEYDSAVGRLAGATLEEQDSIRDAVNTVESGGELSYEQSKHLKGFSLYDEQVKAAERQQAMANDPSGILDKLAERLEQAKEKEQQLKLDVNAKNELKITLESQAEDQMKDLLVKLDETIRPMLTNYNEILEKIEEMKINSATKWGTT